MCVCHIERYVCKHIYHIVYDEYMSYRETDISFMISVCHIERCVCKYIYIYIDIYIYVCIYIYMCVCHIKRYVCKHIYHIVYDECVSYRETDISL